jgi:prepilin-type processing-associated H-X9-DG protein
MHSTPSSSYIQPGVDHCRTTRNLAGLSLVEILVVVAILALLAGLLLPVFHKMKEGNQAAKCVNNLRALAALIPVLAADNDGRIEVFSEGNDAFEKRWKMQLERLMGHTTAVPSGPSSPFLCPSAPESTVPHWHCYGMIMAAPPGTKNAGFYRVRLAQIERPANTPVFADSFSIPIQKQIFRIRTKTNAATEGIHLRHNGLANVAFYDGHVEAASPKRLRELGFTQAVDGERKVINLPAEP